MSATLCGFLVTAYTMMGFVGQFVLGYICDKLKTNKKVYIVAYAVALVLIFLTFTSSNWILVIVLYGCLGFVQQPMMAVHDTWILKTYHETPWMYGPIRAFGSLTFAIFNLFYGDLLGSFGYNIMMIFAFIFIAMGITTAILTPDAPVTKAIKLEKKENSYKVLLSNKKFVAVLVLMFGVGMIHNPLCQLTALLISNVGGDQTYLGYALFASAMMQVPMMALASKIKHISPILRISLGGLLYCVSGIGNAFATTPIAVVGFICFTGLGLGLFTTTAREMITLVSPKEYLTSAQSLGDSMLFCLAGVLSNALAGFLFDFIGVTKTLLILSSIAIFAIATFLILIRSADKRTE